MPGKSVQYNHNVVVTFSATGQQQLIQAFQNQNTALLGYNKNLQTNIAQVANTNKAQQAYQQSVTQSTQVTKTFSAGLAQNTPFVAGLSNQVKSTGAPFSDLNRNLQTSGSSFQRWGGFLKNNLANIGLLSGGIAGLDDQYLQLHKAQVANERANLMVSKSEQQVAKTANALNNMRAAGKQNTAEFALKEKDLALAQEKLDIAQQRATVTQENLGEATEDFWVGIIPNALFVGGSAAQMIASLGIKMSTLSKAGTLVKGAFTGLPALISGAGGAASGASGGFAALGVSIAGIAAPVLVAVAGIYTLIGAVRAAQKLNDLVQGKLGGKAIEMSPFERLRIQLFGNPEEKKRAEAWDKQMQKNLVTQEEYNKIMLEAFDPMSMIKDITKGVTDEVGKMWKNTVGATSANQDLTASNDQLGASYAGLNQTMGIGVKMQNTTQQTALQRRETLLKEAQALGIAKDRYIEFIHTGGLSTKQILVGNDALDQLIDKYRIVGPNIQSTTKDLDIINQVLKDHQLVTESATETLDQWNVRVHGTVEQQLKAALAIQTAKDAIAEQTATIRDWVKEFNARDLDVGKALGLDKGIDADKMLKKFVGMLPKNLEKEFKQNLKLDLKLEAKKSAIVNFVTGLIDSAAMEGGKRTFFFDPELKVDQKKAVQYGKTLAKIIGENTGDPKLDKLQDNLEAAIESGSQGGITQAIVDIQQYLDEKFAVPVKFTEADMALFKQAVAEGAALGFKAGVTGAKIPPISVPVKPTFGVDTKSDADWKKIMGMKYNQPDQYYISGYNSQGKPIYKHKKENMSYTNQNEFTWQGTGWFSPFADPNQPSGPLPANRFPPVDKKGNLLEPRNSRNLRGSGRLLQVAGGGVFGQDALGQIVKANPLDILARQIDQITKNLNVYARAIVQVTNNNNQFARTVVTITKDNNQLARTTVTVTKDYNQEARAIVQTTKDNNQIAKTIVQITKNNNTYAKTIVQVTKDINVLARATVQETKNNNTFARTINQVTNNMKDEASAAKKLASAIRSIPSGGGFRGGNVQHGGVLINAQEGLEGIVTRPTTYNGISIGEHSKPELITVSPLTNPNNVADRGLNLGGTTIVHLNIKGSDLVRETDMWSKIGSQTGKNIGVFGV